MAQLRQDYLKFMARDVEIVVIGPENAQAFSAYFKKESLPFIGLPDPKASVLKLYGQEVNLFKLGRMPAQVLIDKAGIARFVHYGHSMMDISSNEEILSLVDEMNAHESGNKNISTSLQSPTRKILTTLNTQEEPS
jgi:peroxiredoxin